MLQHIKEYTKLLRIKHYIKNFLIFLPIFFGREIFDKSKLCNAILGFVCFCSISSAVYIFNDYRDIDKDRAHPTKKNRPLASGRISKKVAIITIIICLCIALIGSMMIGNINGAICLYLYLVLNILYSLGMKNMPIIDIAILASGFVIRVFYGGFITNITISKWLYLVITTGSLYMGLGKRRNELKRMIAGGERKFETRNVLKYYNEAFLDKNMYVCMGLTNVFYAMWTIEMPNNKISWTVPAFFIILMYYSLDIEGDSEGDPIEVIFKDRVLICIVAIYFICIFYLIYI